MKEWFTAAELADLRLPQLPKTQQNIKRRAKSGGWASRGRRGRGGGREYHVSNLPQAARDALAERMLQSASASTSAEASADRDASAAVGGDLVETCGAGLPALPRSAEDLAGWQRACMEARLALLQEVQRRAVIQGLMAARETVARLAGRGALPDHLQSQVVVANQRGGKNASRTLSVPSLRRWEASYAQQGALALAPRPAVPKRELPPRWMAAFMEHYARPSKPSVAACHEELAKDLPPEEMPALRTVQREVKKLSALTRNRGRMGPRELKTLKAYVVRDTADLWPTAVYTSDGHTLDAEVQHPIHGKPFRPEVTLILDVKTRRVVGWSAALSENAIGTADALRHAFTECGICDVFYVDLGGGFNNAQLEDPSTGLLSRFGVTKTNSLPYNSQARGVAERAHKSILVRGAKKLATFVGADMDREARQAAFKATRKDIAAVGTSRLLPSWNSFLAWAQEQVDAYNARPQSGLPKVRDPETLKLRHQTPNEAWQAALDDGWQLDRIPREAADDLFRPAVKRKTRRGMVSIFNNSYFHPALEAFHGEHVYVGYDIHDASRVWVRDLDQRLICIADFEGNKVAYYPVSFLEQAHEKRVRGRLARNDAKRADIEAELKPALIEHQAEQPIEQIQAEQLQAGERAFVEIEERNTEPAEPVQEIGGRPVFSDDVTWADWLLEHPDRVTPEDEKLLAECLRRSSFRQLADFEGIQLSALERLLTSEKRSIA